MQNEAFSGDCTSNEKKARIKEKRLGFGVKGADKTTERSPFRRPSARLGLQPLHPLS